MEKLIVEEICKNLKWHEKIIVTILKKTFIKAYNNQRLKTINLLLH